MTLNHESEVFNNPLQQNKEILALIFIVSASFDSTFFIGLYLHSSAAWTIHRCSGILSQAGDMIGEEGQYEALTLASMMQLRATC